MKVLQVEQRNYNERKLLISFLQSARELNLPVVFYRNPYERTPNAIIGSTVIDKYSINSEQPEKGFIFSPFDNFNNTKSLFIRSGVRLSGRQIIADLPINTPILHRIVLKLKTNLRSTSLTIPEPYFPEKIQSIQKSNVNYKTLVEQAVSLLKKGNLEKVVLASRKEVEPPSNFNVVDMFLQLTEKYKRAFISMVSIPDIGTWMGATPEQLMIFGDQRLQSISLAGTKKHYGKQKPEWREKEYMEQKMVTDYIESCYHAAGFDNYLMDGPETAIAGNVMHLKTNFSAACDDTETNKVNLFLNHLHPTPAICGLPKLAAYDFIKSHEGFQREFYAGYLGPAWLNGKLDLFVNLRCMNLTPKNIRLYSGAGITADSVPENEVTEIDLKFNTLLSAINELDDRKEEDSREIS